MAEHLEIIIEAKDQFSKQFSKLTGYLPSLRTAVLASSAAVVGLGTAIFASTKQVANAHDELQKLGSQLKLSTEFLSGMQHVAELSGISNMNKGIQMLQVRIGEAARGLGQGKEAFDFLGVQIRKTTGEIKTAEDLLPELAEAFHQVGNATLAAEAASKIFGQENIKMIQAFTDGKNGIKSMLDEAERFNLIVGQQAANNAAAFNDSLYRIRAALKGLQNAFAEDLMPLLAGAFNRIAYFIADNREKIMEWSKAFISWIAKAVEYGAYGIAILIDSFRGLKMIYNVVLIAFVEYVQMFLKVFDFWLDKIQIGMEALNFRGMFDGAIANLESFSGKITDVIGGLQEVQDTAWTNLNKIVDEGSAVGKVKAFSDAVKNALAEIRAEGTQSSEIPGLVQGQTTILAPDTTEYDKKLQEQRQKEYEDTIAHLDQIRTLWQEHTKTRLEQLDIWYEDQLEKAGEFEEARFMLSDIYRARKKEIEEADAEEKAKLEGDSLEGTQKFLEGSFALSQAFGAKAFRLQQGLSVAKATMSAFEAFNVNLATYAYPLGPILAGLALATGLAQVATIAAQKPAGAAHGGLENVPAEQTYLLNKGERVLSPSQNKDLTEFLESGGGISNPTLVFESGSIQILPNATNASALLSMDSREIEEIVEEKIIPALSRLASSGIKP